MTAGGSLTWQEWSSDSSQENNVTLDITSYYDYCCYNYNYHKTKTMRAANIASVVAEYVGN